MASLQISSRVLTHQRGEKPFAPIAGLFEPQQNLSFDINFYIGSLAQSLYVDKTFLPS
jgi:hypothetical protein